MTEAIEVTKKCPYCAETIKVEAIVCRHCGRDLSPAVAPVKQGPNVLGILIVVSLGIIVTMWCLVQLAPLLGVE